MENTAPATTAVDGIWRETLLPYRDYQVVYGNESTADFGTRLTAGMAIVREAEFGGLPPSACLEA